MATRRPPPGIAGPRIAGARHRQCRLLAVGGTDGARGPHALAALAIRPVELNKITTPSPCRRCKAAGALPRPRRAIVRRRRQWRVRTHDRCPDRHPLGRREHPGVLGPARRGVLLIKRCAACGKPHFYPARSARTAGAPTCTGKRPVAGPCSTRTPSCAVTTWPRSPTGCLTWRAIVDLAEGPRAMTDIVEVALDDVHIGMAASSHVRRDRSRSDRSRCSARLEPVRVPCRAGRCFRPSRLVSTSVGRPGAELGLEDLATRIGGEAVDQEDEARGLEVRHVLAGTRRRSRCRIGFVPGGGPRRTQPRPHPGARPAPPPRRPGRCPGAAG